MHQSDDEKSKANTIIQTMANQNYEIKTMTYHRDYLKKKAISLKSATLHESYKRCRNQVKQANKLLNKQSKCTLINEVKVNGSKVNGDTNIANEFNNFFSTIGPRLANDILHQLILIPLAV
jgi:ribosomal protein L3